MLSNNVDLLNDMNTLMKGVKKREQTHLSLVDYIKKVINNHDDSCMFIQEEIRAHRLFQTDFTAKEQKIRQEETVLGEKYATKMRLEESEIKFIGRLSMRILEICQASFEKLKQFFNFYEEAHTVFHETVSKMVQNDHLDLPQLISLIVAYSRGKYDEDAKSLQLMIEMIERGDKELVWRVVQEREDKRVQLIQERRLEQQRRRKEMILESELQHRKEKEKLADRISRVRDLAKQAEKTRKRKVKYLDKVYCKVYGVLDTDRRELMDNIIFVCKPEEQYKRMYTDILERNKFVKDQISEFSSKANDIKQKIKRFKESMLLSPLMRPKSKKISTSTDVPQACSSMECLTTAAAEIRIKETKEIVSQRLSEAGEPESATSRPERDRKSVESNLDRRSENRMELHHRFPVISSPFVERRQRKERYQQMLTKARRLSQTKNDSPNNSMRQTSRVMQVPLIQLNMVEKFEFKVHQPRKKEVISKAFEYTFHFRRRQNRFQETRNNFVL